MRQVFPAHLQGPLTRLLFLVSAILLIHLFIHSFVHSGNMYRVRIQPDTMHRVLVNNRDKQVVLMIEWGESIDACVCARQQQGQTAKLCQHSPGEREPKAS